LRFWPYIWDFSQVFKQIILPLLGVAVFIILVGLFVQKSSSLHFLNFPPQSSPVSQKTIRVGDKNVLVEVVSTPSTRSKGLSGRSSLAQNSGMLFIFDKKDITPSFWMKDMLIPLDIIWIDDGKIVVIDKNVSAPKAGVSDSELKVYSPGKPVDYVLEMNADFCDDNNIKVGDSVDLSGI
jgi:uncharacterized membrane protein (UPF0127 family)